MAKSTPKFETTIIDKGFLEITGNVGNGYFLKGGEPVMIKKGMKVPKKTKIYAGRPYRSKKGEVIFEVSIFTIDHRPSEIVYISLFKKAQAWISGKSKNHSDELQVHSILQTGDHVAISGKYQIKRSKNVATGEVRDYHQIAINYPSNIVRLKNESDQDALADEVIAQLA